MRPKDLVVGTIYSAKTKFEFLDKVLYVRKDHNGWHLFRENPESTYGQTSLILNLDSIYHLTEVECKKSKTIGE